MKNHSKYAPLPAARPISERHVQALWYDGALRPDNLRTVDGAPLRVIDPGAWNLESGPDFRGATVEAGSVRLRGDVEVHLRSADWAQHGHSEDPEYANVAVHVTWYGGGRQAPLPPGCVEVCIGQAMRARGDFSPDEIDLAAYPYARLASTPRPCEAVFSRDPDFAAAVLCAAGARRIEGKARRLKALFMRKGDRAQVFYEEMMGALGYKRNAAAFRALAEAMPWISLPPDAACAETALACAAGLRARGDAPWRTANVRPANSPERRLAAAAALFAGTRAGLMRELDACDLASKDGQRAACRMLQSKGRMGAGRAAAMLANVVIPFALAEGRLARVPQWLCPEDVCAPVRLTAYRILGRDHNPALYAWNGLLLQGLLHIHREFCICARPGCAGCRLVEAARQ